MNLRKEFLKYVEHCSDIMFKGDFNTKFQILFVLGVGAEKNANTFDFMGWGGWHI
jgi:hypothetical protein